jgi:AcrR family transcriptional regulator
MAKKSQPAAAPEGGGRKARADATRNRERLLAAAKTCFARDGAGTSLEEVARSAGVGIGTLYRHFPTRDDLIAAVYRQAIGQLAEAAATLAAKEPPREALRHWLLLFVDYIATKKLMAGALASLAGGPNALYAASGEMLREAIKMLTAKAASAKAIRPPAEPFDLLRAIGGLAYPQGEPGWEKNAKAMVDILIAGMKRD